jgi:hypothetical protein
MSKKKVAIAPQSALPAPSADKWVDERTMPKESKQKLKRLTVDIPDDLHLIIKRSCVDRRVSMMDEIREMLEAKYRGEA